MISAERKPFGEIKASIRPHKRILMVGCATCVAECAAGGEKEVGSSPLSSVWTRPKEGRQIEIKEMTLDRQCVYEFIDQVTPVADQYDVILSLGCGAGVQAMAEVLPKIHIVPALNTTSSPRRERQGCGSRTAGAAATASSIILPISALLPAVPRGFSTVPAAARKRAAARRTRIPVRLAAHCHAA